MKKIFLSASIPARERDPQYYNSADLDAITSAVKALARVIIPETHVVWGGHPAITPMIRTALSGRKTDLKKHVTVYQSEFFRDKFPQENKEFGDVVVVPKKVTREESLEDMRRHMIGDHDYVAGIFIGGMEGVRQEFELFRKTHPDAALLPIASTGAAAKQIYDELKEEKQAPDEQLENQRTYAPLFRELLKQYMH